MIDQTPIYQQYSLASTSICSPSENMAAQRLSEFADGLLATLEPNNDILSIAWPGSHRIQDDFRTENLDHAEEKLLRALSLLRIRRNSLAPIHRLLPEILAQIFALLLQQPEDFLPEQLIDPYHWLGIIHVCWLWRTVALSCAPLWANIHGNLPKCAQLAHQHSAESPLKIYLIQANYQLRTTSEDVALFNTVAKECSRLQQFHLRNFRGLIDESHLLQLRFPSPQLESLSIVLEKSDESFTDANLPPLFDSHTPRLKRLTLHYFTSWSGNNFVNLTHLCLHHQHEDMRVGLPQFLDFLDASPGLEHLGFVNAGPRWSDLRGGYVPGRAVRLEHLRSLDIGQWQGAEAIGTFLCYLRIPRTTQICLWGGDLMLNHETLSDIFPSFSDHRAALDNITQLRFTLHDVYNLDVPLITLSKSTLQINGDFRPNQVLTEIPRVCSSLHNVTELWLGRSYNPEPTRDEWKTFLQCFPSLTTLVISKRSSGPIVSALTLHHEEEVDDSPLLCPKLSTLRLYICNNDSISTLYLSVFGEERLQQGRPISCLHAYTFDVSPMLKSEIKYLRKFIADVVLEDFNGEVCSELIDVWPTPVYKWTRRSDRY